MVAASPPPTIRQWQQTWIRGHEGKTGEKQCRPCLFRRGFKRELHHCP
ncbi:unnamed protein product, partial [Larinioides sclopetarius]